MCSHRLPLSAARRFLGVALALSAASILSHAQANGRVVEFQTKTAGPYEIALGTVPNPPIVGALHLTVSVTTVETETPVTDAAITVSGTGPGEDAPKVGPVEASNSPTDPVFYDATTAVDRLGLWTFTVTVDSEPGKASADFVLEVRESNPILKLVTWVTVVVFLALVGLGLYPFVRDRLRKSTGETRKRSTR